MSPVWSDPIFAEVSGARQSPLAGSDVGIIQDGREEGRASTSQGSVLLYDLRMSERKDEEVPEGGRERRPVWEFQALRKVA